ncbi:MAG: HEAT repeat domain-containing protein [Leptospirales bacterium]
MFRYYVILLLMCISFHPVYSQSEESVEKSIESVTRQAELMLSIKYATDERHMEQLVILLEQKIDLPKEYWKKILVLVHDTGHRGVRTYLISRFLKQYPFDTNDQDNRKKFVNVVNDEFIYLLDRDHHSDEELVSIRSTLAIVEKLELGELFYPTAAFIAYPLIDIRKLSYKALAKFNDDRMFPLLLQLADSKSPVERTYAVDAFYYIKDDRIIPVLLNLINDRNKTVRYYVIRTLENMEAAAAVPYIIRIVRSDVNPEVRVRAIQMLEKVKPRSGFSALNQAVFDDSSQVREAALNALIAYGNRSSAYYISEQLEKEKKDKLKLLQIQALLRLNSSGKMEGLNKIMRKEKNREIVIWAIYVTGRLKDHKGLDAIIKNLTHDDERVRVESAHALAYIKSRHSISHLIKRLSDEKEKYSVQVAALYALVSIDDSSVIPVLFDLSEEHSNAYLRKQIKQMLRKMLAQRFEK